MATNTNKTQNIVNINQKEIINLVYQTATSTYGVAGVAKKDVVMNAKTSLVSSATANKGIFIKKAINTFDVTIYLVLAKEVKITEALSECKKAVKYVLNRKYPKMCKKINIYAVGIN